MYFIGGGGGVDTDISKAYIPFFSFHPSKLSIVLQMQEVHGLHCSPQKLNQFMNTF